MTVDATNTTLLAIDCSQRETCLALLHGGSVHARRFDPAARVDPAAGVEREVLWDELRALFGDAGATVESLEAIAVATGPGGFTGLRVAVGCAKGIAFARGIPVVAVPSAIVFAASDRARGGRGPWLLALASKSGTAWVVEASEAADQEDSEEISGERRGENGNHGGNHGAVIGRTIILSEPAVLGAEQFAAIAADMVARGGVLLADEHLGDVLSQVAARQGLSIRPFGVDPEAMLRESVARLARGITIDPLALSPIYAREPEAVTKWRERALSARSESRGG